MQGVRKKYVLRRRARLSRRRSLYPQSLDQLAGNSGQKVVLEYTLSGRKARL